MFVFYLIDYGSDYSWRYWVILCNFEFLLPIERSLSRWNYLYKNTIVPVLYKRTCFYQFVLNYARFCLVSQFILCVTIPSNYNMFRCMTTLPVGLYFVCVYAITVNRKGLPEHTLKYLPLNIKTTNNPPMHIGGSKGRCFCHILFLRCSTSLALSCHVLGGCY